MKNPWAYICIFLALALLWQVKCNTPKAEPVVVINKETEAHKRIIYTIKRERDSLRAIVVSLQSTAAIAKTVFETSGKKVIKSNTAYKEAVIKHDTVRIFLEAANISNEVDTAEVKYAIMDAKADSLANVLAIQRRQDSTTIAWQQTDYEKLLNRPVPKKPSRINFGPAIIVTYLNGKVAPAFGIGVTYNLFK